MQSDTFCSFRCKLMVKYFNYNSQFDATIPGAITFLSKGLVFAFKLPNINLKKYEKVKSSSISDSFNVTKWVLRYRWYI